MSSIVKLNKGQLSAYASDLKTKSDTLSTEISDLSSDLSSVASHDKFPDLKAKCSMIAKSIGNLDLDFKHVSGNISKYIENLSRIDAEGFDVDFDYSSDKSTSTGLSTTTSTSPSTSTSTNSGYSNNSSNTSNSNNFYSSSSTTSTSSSSGTTVINNYYYNTSSRSDGNYSYSYSTSPSGTVIHTNTSATVSNNSVSLFPSSNLTNKDFDVPAGGKYNYGGIEKYLEDEKGITVEVPEGLGNIHTYMGWQMITDTSSNQYKLREAAGMNFDEEGFGKIGDRYVIACTTTFGNVGDFIDVYMEDGTVLKCVIGDIKSQGDEGCNKWGHNNGDCVIEFVVDKDMWYSNGRGSHSNPGTSSCHPEWNKEIDKIVNKGNFFDLIKTDAAKFTEEDLKVAEKAGLLNSEEVEEV